MKRFICLFLALLLLCPVAHAKSDLKLILTAPEGTVGETVTVTAEVKGAPVVCSYKVVITYDDTILKPEKIENINSLGFFMENTDTEHNGKPAINALSVDASKAFEGDCKLFSATFKILKAPAKEGSPLKVVYTEFYDYDLKMLTPEINSCSITVAGAGDNNGGSGDNSGEDTPSNNETPEKEDPKPDDGNATPDTEKEPDIGNSNAEGDKKDPNDKKPTGNWYIDKDLEDVAHTNEDGTIDEYKGNFIYDENDKLTKVELTDKDGKPAGSIKVNESDSGILRVEEQDLIDSNNKETNEAPSEEEPDLPAADDEEEKKPLNPLVWIIPVAVVLIAAGGAVAYLMIKKHKKEEE